MRPYIERHLIVQRQSDDHYDVQQQDTPDRNPDQMQEHFQSMPPRMLESFQRHMIWHHLHPSFHHYDEDHLLIDFFYAEAVYASLYYGYGQPGTFADRRRRARAWETETMNLAPDTVIVLVKATADVICQRLRDNLRPTPLSNRHVEQVLQRYDEEYNNSLIYRRISLDTS